jgi:hypothetical protein
VGGTVCSGEEGVCVEVQAAECVGGHHTQQQGWNTGQIDELVLKQGKRDEGGAGLSRGVGWGGGVSTQRVHPANPSAIQRC